MAYRRTTWLESETALSAEHMNNIEDGIEEALAKSKGNEDMWHYIRQYLYPVGSIYMSVNNIDPSTVFGGTWVPWGEGRVPVGVNSDETEFNAAENVGGAKTVTLTASQSGLRAHAHGFTQPTVDGGAIVNGITGGAHTHTVSYSNYGRASGTGQESSLLTYSATSKATSSVEHTHNLPAHTHSVRGGAVQQKAAEDATAAHNNLQPYITCYMWKRTA